MNLMLNTYCNLQCSYCFAQKEMANSITNISIENLRIFLNFLKENNEKEVRLIGGEPTLHPELEKILDEIISYNYFDSILIFSNFTFNRDIANMFIEKSKKIRMHFLPNINNFLFLSEEFKKRILYNLDILTASIEEMDNIGINIYSPDMDLSQWEDIICKYNIKRVRWSITLPSKKPDEDFNIYDYFHSYQRVLLELASWAPKYGIVLNNDCNGIPPCCLDSSALEYIFKIDPNFLGPVHCMGAVVDVTPTLELKGCFVIGDGENKKITDFNCIEQIEEYFKEKRLAFEHKPIRKECLSCPRFLTTKNSCSCLIYRK